MISLPQKPQALFFNLPRDARCEKIERFLQSKGVSVRHIPPADHGHPIGFLLGLPGYEAAAARSFFGFGEEMLLMSGFDRSLLNELLTFFSREKLRRIELKAMLTPTNAGWSAVELHSRLSAERRMMSGLKK